jgi:hypothetical protein
LKADEEDRKRVAEEAWRNLKPPFLHKPKEVVVWPEKTRFSATIDGRLTVKAPDGGVLMNDTAIAGNSAPSEFNIAPGFRSVQFTPTDVRFKGAVEHYEYVIYNAPMVENGRVKIELDYGLNKSGLSIDWGDGKIELSDPKSLILEHVYSAPGKKTVRIIPPAKKPWAAHDFEVEVK